MNEEISTIEVSVKIAMPQDASEVWMKRALQIIRDEIHVAQRLVPNVRSMITYNEELKGAIVTSIKTKSSWD